MAKVYIVDFTNFEYSDEYFYESGSISPDRFFTKKSEAQKFLAQAYLRVLTTDKEYLNEYIYDREVFLFEITEVQHRFDLIGSSISIPENLEDQGWDRNYDWIPETLTDKELDIFMECLNINLGQIVELKKLGQL